MKALRLTAMLLSAGMAGIMAAPEAAAQVEQIEAEMNIIPDKTTKTEGGIRISLCLVGIPHTSQRIDGVDLVIGKKIVKATDIDGVDFERYFQFEDEGVVTIDIDFPFKGTVPKTAKLIFHTAKGKITSPARQ